MVSLCSVYGRITMEIALIITYVGDTNAYEDDTYQPHMS